MTQGLGRTVAVLAAVVVFDEPDPPVGKGLGIDELGEERARSARADHGRFGRVNSETDYTMQCGAWGVPSMYVSTKHACWVSVWCGSGGGCGVVRVGRQAVEELGGGGEVWAAVVATVCVGEA